ncbi:MAG: glutamine-hydrolyzing carbamoyl-phosphate synthase small subunit [Oscillospiraceae bacterium]|jgi:carbamoyl-phosphate synthase small subunit|nr:glutamine-hydrolyzing carbamoyl-phosphate synthase small subunit [Oscillospiraceae bacterium]
MNKRAWLILEDGTVFEGFSFGAEGKVTGEVIFTTSMTGFQETLTDPNYNNQIIVQTFPLVGNVGANSKDDSSDYGGAAGYIAREYCEFPSNFRMETTLDEFLKERGIVGLYGIDTRRLTRILREKGTMNGQIADADPKSHELDDFFESVRYLKQFKPETDLISAAEPVEYKTENAKYNIALIDYGHKRSIVSLLNKLNCDVAVVPFTETSKNIIAGNYNGVVLSNGAGNPADCTEEIEAIKALVNAKIPLLGIGLGHQLLALANGGATAKLKHGHRGANLPVIDLETGRTFITTQNHGYIVEGIPEQAGKITHINANDKTCEGISYNNIKALSMQFVPSDEGGVNATVCFIEKFLRLI